MSGCALKATSADVFVTKQAVSGQIDPSPIFNKVRRTDGRVTQQNTFEKSSELKSNLQGQKNTLTDVGYSNTFSVEITQNIILFAESILMNNESISIDIEATTISFNATDNEITDSGLSFVDIEVGQWVFVKGSSMPELNKPYYVKDKPDDGTLKVIDVPIDSPVGDNIGIAGIMYRSGNTEHLLSVQGRDEHIGATNDTDYKTQIDAVVDTLSIAVPQTGLLTGSATVIASTQLDNNLDEIAGQTDAVEDNSDVLGSAIGYAGFYPNQIDQSNNFADVTIDIIRNTGVQSVAGKLGAKCVTQDVIGITGTLTSLRRAIDPAQEESKYDGSERFSMSFGFQWDDGKFLMITMREMIYTDGSIASATGEFANFAGTYDAEEDTFGTTIQFDTNIVIDDYIAPTGVIVTPVGTDVIPAIATFTGDFLIGTTIDIQGTTDGVQPMWGWQITLENDYTSLEFTEQLAIWLSGNDGITFNSNGNQLEVLGILGTTAVTIDILDIVAI